MKKLLLIIIGLSVMATAGAQSWTGVYSGSANWLNGCSFGDNQTVYVTGVNKTLLKSTDGGQTFTSLSTSFLTGNLDFSSCFFTSADTGYVSGGNYNSFPTDGFIYKTTNGGTSWTLKVSGIGSAFGAITFPSSQVGYAIGGEANFGIIYKTTDFGNTWTSIYNSSPVANWLTSAHFFNNTEGVVVGNDEGVFEAKIMKVSSGQFASASILSSYVCFTDVYFINPDTGFVTAFGNMGNQILKTTNQGLSWTPVYTGTGQFRSITFVSPMKGYAVAGGGLIVSTTDGGNTWIQMASPTTNQLTFIEFDTPEYGLITGDAGTILKFSIETSLNEYPGDDASVSIYPNPATDYLTVELLPQINNPEKKICIYNAQGRLLIDRDLQQAKTDISLEGLPAGIYTVRVNGGGINVVKNIIRE